jgi:hypothetical protein
MRKILLALFSFSFSILFFACSDSIVTSNPYSSVSWQLLDSLTVPEIIQISMADENTVFAAASPVSYKFTPGAKTAVNFSDTTFIPSAVDAYSTSYYVFAGRSYLGSEKTVLKIFNGGTLSEAAIIPGGAFNPKVIKIIEPGKIYVTVNEKVYYYNNGAVITYTAPDVVELYNMAVQGTAIYFTGVSGFNQGIYKLEGGAFTRAEYVSSSTSRTAADNNIFKTESGSNVTTVSKWNGSGWNFFADDAKGKSYISASGNNSGFIYFLKQDSATNAYGGSFWNGASISNDANYRFSSFLFPITSNMRGNSFCLFTRSIGKSYLYKGTAN